MVLEAVRIELRPSLAIALWLGGAHLLALSGIWLAPLGWPIAAAGSLAIGMSLLMTLRRHALRTAPDAIVALELHDAASACVRSRDGGVIEGRVAGSSFVSPSFTIVNLRPEAAGRLRTVLVTPDCVDGEAFRRLRVRLRWDRTGARDASAADQP